MLRMLSSKFVYSLLSLCLLQPGLKLLKSPKSMRDLVLLRLFHLRIPMAVRNQVQRNFWTGAYVLPSTSNIGSQPVDNEWVKMG